MMKIQKHTGKHWGEQEQLRIRAFKTTQAALTFVSKQRIKAADDLWQEYDGPLGAGTYAMGGGRWLNVKSLSASRLAHL